MNALKKEVKSQYCEANDIIEINRNKEYTLISTDLLESVLTDTRLNAQTTKLWQILFNKVRYNQNLEIKISYSYLAKSLNKSARTIARYIDSLQKSGYLIVKHNFDKNGGQRPSTISVRVPTFLIEHAKKRKDRQVKNTSDNNTTYLIKAEYPQSNIATIETRPVNVADAEQPNEPGYVLCGTIESKTDLKIDVAVEDKPSVSGHTQPPIIADKDELISQAKNDREGDDINVLHNDSNKKEINKNNNNVVVSISKKDETNDQITLTEQEISALEHQLQLETNKIYTLTDNSLRYLQIRKTSEIEGTLTVLKYKLDRIIKQAAIALTEKKNQENLKKDPALIFNQAGERPVPIFTFKRLVKSLQAYGNTGEKLHGLVNEVIFEARFGNLVNCNKTKMPLSLDNAINIALKLIREQRWSTPTLLKKYN